jgi:hypothetical protein
VIIHLQVTHNLGKTHSYFETEAERLVWFEVRVETYVKFQHTFIAYTFFVIASMAYVLICMEDELEQARKPNSSLEKPLLSTPPKIEI